MDKLPKLSSLTTEDTGWGYFLCTYKEVRAGRSGSEFLFLSLQDSSQQVVAKLLADVERYKNEFDAGEFVRVEGRGSLYNGQLQLVLTSIRRINPDQDRREGFREEDAILSAPRPIDEMWAELQGHLQGVKNSHIRVLLNRTGIPQIRVHWSLVGTLLHPPVKLGERDQRTIKFFGNRFERA